MLLLDSLTAVMEVIVLDLHHPVSVNLTVNALGIVVQISAISAVNFWFEFF